jgi:hypothetical protein
MIRPFTCVCLLMAGASGLYLYHEKYRVQLLDQQIAQTVKATEATRARTNMLRAEWTLLNEPQRLQDLASHYLQLQPLAPSQFVQLADLDSHLPPPVSPDVQPAAPPAPDGSGVPVASAPPAAGTELADAAPPQQDAAPSRDQAAAPPAPPPAQPRVAAVAAVPVHPELQPELHSDPQAAAPRPAAPVDPVRQNIPEQHPADHRAQVAMHRPPPAPRPQPQRRVMAPVVEAFATPVPQPDIRAPRFRRTEALMPLSQPQMPAAQPPMAVSVLSAAQLPPPVPVPGAR